MITIETNDTAQPFREEKVSAVIDDPAVADLLIPEDHPIGAKRIWADDNYFQTFNAPHARLVDLKTAPIERVDAGGVHTFDAYYQLDALVPATGFNAMPGSVEDMNIVGRSDTSLNDTWSAVPVTYLGLGVPGLPNLCNTGCIQRTPGWTAGWTCRGRTGLVHLAADVRRDEDLSHWKVNR